MLPESLFGYSIVGDSLLNGMMRGVKDGNTLAIGADALAKLKELPDAEKEKFLGEIKFINLTHSKMPYIRLDPFFNE